MEDKEKAVNLSYSQIGQYRSCPQKWNYSRIQGYERIDRDAAVWMHFGSWWHALRAAESLERGRALDSIRRLPRGISAGDREFDPATVTVEEVLHAAEKWQANLDPEIGEEWDKALVDPLADRLAYVDEEWRARWAAEREVEVPLTVEMGWGRELVPGVRLVGYVDEIYYDDKRGMVVIRDHKTGGSLGTQSALDDMMDSQLQFYAWGVSPEVESWGVGEVGAVAYDRARSSRPKKPKLNLDGTLSKSVVDYNLRAYREWVASGPTFPGRAKDGSGAGVYVEDPAVVAHLSDPASLSAWFQRTLVPLNRHIVGAHLRAAMDTAEDMGRMRERIVRTNEAARNLGGGCRWCDFSALCRAQLLGGPDGDYVLADFNLRRAG